MQHYAMLALALGLLPLGCGAPYSNDIFEEDALFTGALPHLERVAINQSPAADGASREGACPEGTYRKLTINTINDVNDIIALGLDSVETITSHPITDRSENLRRWGPFLAPGDNFYLTLTIERREDRLGDTLVTRYHYWLNGAPTQDETGHPVFWGVWQPIDSMEKGLGDFTYDFNAWATLSQNPQGKGRIDVTFDTTGPRAVWAEIDEIEKQGSPMSLECHFVADAQRGGYFQYELYGNLVTNTSALERLNLEARWLDDKSGRAEGWYTDGDLQMNTMTLTECWSTQGCMNYYQDSIDLEESFGDEGACSLDDVTLPH